MRRVCEGSGGAETDKPVLMKQASLDYVILYLLGVTHIPLILSFTSSEYVLWCPLGSPVCAQLTHHRSVPRPSSCHLFLLVMLSRIFNVLMVFSPTCWSPIRFLITNRAACSTTAPR